MLPIVLAVVGALLALFLVYIALQPADFKVVRTASIPAPPSAVFPHVNDLHKWEAWSPWAKMDPDARTTYAGAAAGPGASFAWSGNNKVGQGSMTITDSRADESVQIRLDFLKPMKGTNNVTFTFQSAGPGTVVTWAMTGKYNFMGKLFNFFINCEKMCGGQFDQGLGDLKSVVQNASPSVMAAGR